MVLDNDRPILKLLKNIKSDAPYDVVNSEDYAAKTGEQLIPKSVRGTNMEKWDVVCFNRDIKQMFVMSGGIAANEFIGTVKELLNTPTHKHRVVCKNTGYEILNQQIKKINGEWLKDLPAQTGILYLDDVYCIYKIERDNDGIKFKFYQGIMKKQELHLMIEGRLNLEIGQWITKHSELSDIITKDELNAVCGTWLRVLFFLQFAEVDTKIVNHQTRKVKIGSEKILNNTDFKFEIIDSNYYTNIIRTEGFGVSGHWRYQPFGSGRMEKKLIYIKDFQKEGYSKNAKIKKTDI